MLCPALRIPVFPPALTYLSELYTRPITCMVQSSWLAFLDNHKTSSAIGYYSNLYFQFSNLLWSTRFYWRYLLEVLKVIHSVSAKSLSFLIYYLHWKLENWYVRGLHVPSIMFPMTPKKILLTSLCCTKSNPEDIKLNNVSFFFKQAIWWDGVGPCG